MRSPCALLFGNRRPKLELNIPALVVVMLAVCACTAKPLNQRFVAAVDVEGNDELGASEITENLATRATPKFAWLVRGLFYDYETYNPHVLARDLLRIRRLYHAHGFHHVQVTAGRVILVDDDRVNVTLVIDEGPQTLVSAVRISGMEDLRDGADTVASEAFLSEVPRESEYNETRLKEASDLLARSLQDRGYAYAKAEFSVQVDLPHSLAQVIVRVEPGPKVTLGDIDLRGFRKIPEHIVRGMLNLRSGNLYRRSEFVEAEQELISLGVFNSVTVKLALDPSSRSPGGEDEDGANTSAPSSSSSSMGKLDSDTAESDTAESDTAESDTADSDTADSEGTGEAPSEEAKLLNQKELVVPVIIEVQQSKLRSLTLGGGIEADIIKSGVHLSGSWRDQNMLGGLRDFSVTVTPGVAFYPTRVPEFAAPDHYLPQVNTQVRFSQPGIPERRTKTIASVNYDIYPVLLTPDPADDAPIIGYRELRGRVGLERKFGPFGLVPSYNLQAGVPFAYVGNLAATATSVYISYVELLADIDLRDNRISPTSGMFASTTFQFAGLGGSARDIRIEPEVRGYVPVVRDKSGLAGRLKFGFLFPFNYDTPQGDGEITVEDTQISFFRSFFSGGPQSNRGYPFRGVGPHGAVEFFYPTYEQAVQGVDCSSPDSNSTPECSIPLGGQTLWEASLEFRFTISGPFTAALFCDASDVEEGADWPGFMRPHLSCGLGPRYDTPVGPIRLDVGYRIPGLQVLEGRSRNEGPAEDVLGLPINISFGVGEAF